MKKSTLALILGLTFSAGIVVSDLLNISTGLVSTQKQAKRQTFQPCIENTLDARLPLIFIEWDAVYKNLKKEEAIDFGPTIPVGLHKDLLIPRHCFAVEGFGGTVTFYKRDFISGQGFDKETPYWTPNAGMEKHRKKKAT